jgi:hypothetical protein
MSSTVTNYSQNINVAYPIPGVDNDTQGFRDNFTNIKNALFVASNELSSLILTTVKTTGTNDFSYNELTRVKLKSNTWSAADEVVVTTSSNISFLSGNYQKYAIGGNVDLTVTDWPPLANYSSIFVEVRNLDILTPKTVSFPGSNVLKPIGLTFPYTLTTASVDKPVIFELWTTDQGATVYVKDVVDTASSMTPFMWDPSVGSTGTVALALQANSATVAATVTNPAQPSITSLGTLSEINLNGAVLTYSNNNLIVANATNIAFQSTESVTTTITIGSGPFGSITTLGVASLTDIELGSTFKLYSTGTTYVVKGINTLTNQITVDAFDATSAVNNGVTNGSSVTFNKGVLGNSVYFASGQPTTSIGKSSDKKGAMFVNSSSLNFCYADYNGSTAIWNSISTELLNNAARYTTVAPTSRFGIPGDKKGTIYATSSYLYYCFQDYVSGSVACWGRISLDSSW